jgi:hypothetical protein
MSATDRARGSRHVAGRHFATILMALAVALTAAAIVPSGASAATPSNFQDLGISPNTYQSCVRDEQVLLNDLWYAHAPGPDRLLATDGYYGFNTANDVSSFNFVYGIPTKYVGETTVETWGDLCVVTEEHGFSGAYWHAADCQYYFSP